jgi:hypothetical protein
VEKKSAGNLVINPTFIESACADTVKPRLSIGTSRTNIFDIRIFIFSHDVGLRVAMRYPPSESIGTVENYPAQAPTIIDTICC